MLRSRIIFLFIVFIIQPVIVAQAAVVQPRPIAERETPVEPAQVQESTPTLLVLTRMDGEQWACPPSQDSAKGDIVTVPARHYRQRCTQLETVVFKGLVEVNQAMMAFEVVWKNRLMHCQMANSPVLNEEMLKMPTDKPVNIRREWLGSACQETATSPST